MLILLAFLSGCYGLKTSALNQAVWDNDIKKIKALIDSGAFVDEVAPCPRENFKVYASSPLDLAVLKGNIEAVKTLLDNGADVNLSRYCHALTSGREIIIPGTPAGYYAFKGSALMLSSLIGNLQISRLLLESGADPNQLTEKSMWQPSALNEFDALSFSAELGHSEVTKLLLVNGANPNRSINRALGGGRIDYIVTVLEENVLEAGFVEISTPNIYAVSKFGNAVEFSALAHIAADYYASSDERKAIRLYKQAIKLYPAAINEFESSYKNLVDIGTSPNSGHLKMVVNDGVFSINSVKLPRMGLLTLLKTLNLRQTIKESKVFRPYADGSICYSYIKCEYEMGTDLIAYFLMKIKHSKQNFNLSKTILNCCKENKSLIDCVKSASENSKL